MAKETFPLEQSGMVTVPQERILLSQEETAKADWPVREVRFNKDLGIIVVDVDEIGLVNRLVDASDLSRLNKLGFEPKQGLHMTVTNYESGGQIRATLSSLPPKHQEEMLQAIESLAESLDWSWRPSGELQAFRGRKKKTLKIITRVECPSFDTFYEGLGQLMPSAQFKLYPPHITVLKQPGEVNGRTPSNIGGLVLGRPLLNLDYPTIDS